MLDLTLRIRIHALMLELQKRALPGVIDITPGIRSLQVHFNSRVLTQDTLLKAVIASVLPRGNRSGVPVSPWSR